MRAILCDFDGVIGKTGDDNFNAWSNALAPYAVRIDPEQYFLHEGRRSVELAEIIVKKFGLSLDLIPVLVESKNRFYAASNSFTFYEGVSELIEFAKAYQIQLAVVSGGSRKRLTNPAVTEVLSRFDLLLTGDDCVKGKPDPEPYLAAARKLGVPPDSCVVIENAPLGIEAAKRAGMVCYAVCTTLDRKHLGAADLVVDKLISVLGVLKSPPNILDKK